MIASREKYAIAAIGLAIFSIGAILGKVSSDFKNQRENIVTPIKGSTKQALQEHAISKEQLEIKMRGYADEIAKRSIDEFTASCKEEKVRRIIESHGYTCKILSND